MIVLSCSGNGSYVTGEGIWNNGDRTNMHHQRLEYCDFLFANQNSEFLNEMNLEAQSRNQTCVKRMRMSGELMLNDMRMISLYHSFMEAWSRSTNYSKLHCLTHLHIRVGNLMIGITKRPDFDHFDFQYTVEPGHIQYSIYTVTEPAYPYPGSHNPPPERPKPKPKVETDVLKIKEFKPVRVNLNKID